jgi:hypothetical protein
LKEFQERTTDANLSDVIFAARAKLGSREALQSGRFDRLMAGATMAEGPRSYAVERRLDIVQFALVNRGQTRRHESRAARLRIVAARRIAADRAAALRREVFQNGKDLVPAPAEIFFATFNDKCVHCSSFQRKKCARYMPICAEAEKKIKVFIYQCFFADF